MKTTKKYVIILCSVLLVFFIAALAFCIFSDSENYIKNILTAQFIIFSLAAGSVIIFCAMPPYRKVRGQEDKITKIVLLSDSNSLMEEFSLTERISGLIGKGDTICFGGINDLASAEYEYAVVNLVDNYWYVERVSDERSVGIKRAGEQYVYKLKTGMCYRLQLNDILYIENERLLIL